MPTPNLLSGLNATLSVTASSVSGGGAIDGLVSISGPEPEMGTVETTNLGSTARTFRYTIGDPGSLNFSYQYDPSNANHAFLYTLMSVPKMASWTVTETDPVSTTSKTFTFSGILTNHAFGEASVDNIVVVDCTVKISGVIS